MIDRTAADAQEVGRIFDADWNRTVPKVPAAGLVVSPVNSRGRISSLIDGATKSIDMYQEEVADTAIAGHLGRAVKRGVKVRLITSDDSIGIESLKSKGARVAIMANPYVHAKAIVVDRRRLFVGSENISATSLDRNRELGIILADPSAIKVVESTFNADWAANGGTEKPPTGNGKLSLSVSVNPATVKRYQLLTVTAHTTPAAFLRHRGHLSRRLRLARGRASGHEGRGGFGRHRLVVACRKHGNGNRARRGDVQPGHEVDDQDGRFRNHKLDRRSI